MKSEKYPLDIEGGRGAPGPPFEGSPPLDARGGFPHERVSRTEVIYVMRYTAGFCRDEISWDMLETHN